MPVTNSNPPLGSGLIFDFFNNIPAEKINIFIDDPARAIEMGKSARDKAEYLYSKEKHIERILAIYKNCINNNCSRKNIIEKY